MSTAAAAPVADSAPIDAARDAVAQTRRDVLPFALERWVLLGFVAFLDQCGRGGVGGTLPGLPGSPPVGGSGGGGSTGGLEEWVQAHVAVLATLAVAAVVLVVAVVLLVVWVGSRGVFVYLHCVATSRAELAAPWRRHAALANSYFRWQLALAGSVLAALSGMVGVGVLAAWTATRPGAGPADSLLVGTVVLLIPALVVLMVAAGLASMAMRDFVAPIQLATGAPCGPAARLLLGLIRAHPLAFFLYVVLKMVYGIAQGVVILAAGCLTCCCALIPVVTQTLLQPIFYFERAWPLHLLRRLGYDVLDAGTVPTTPVAFGNP